MKKTSLAIIVTLMLVSCRTGVNKDEKPKTYINDLAYKNISAYTTEDFIKMDYNFLGFIPTMKEYRSAKDQYKKGNKNTFRYLDSIDVQKPFKDSLVIKIYTQNYISASEHSFKIGRNKENDTLMIYNIEFNQQLKADVSNSDSFRKSDYDLDIIEKIIGAEIPIQRIVFSKNFK